MKPVDVVRDLGVFLDSELNMDQHAREDRRLQLFFPSPTPQVGSAHPRHRSYTRTGGWWVICELRNGKPVKCELLREPRCDWLSVEPRDRAVSQFTNTVRR